MLLSALRFQITLFCGLLVYAQSPLQLGYIPLAVRTPYLHGWIVSNQGSSPGSAWPNFYTTNREFGWNGMIRVDGQAYQWMGRSGFNFTRTVTSEITPTKSIFRLEAGPIQFNATFLSPIEPNDYVRQSTPFSYMYIDGFAANDSASHTVQLYSDISGQWVTRDDRAVIIWDTTERNDMVYHRTSRQTTSPMVDNGDISEDGVGYFAMASRPSITWQTGIDVECRKRFADSGIMGNSSDRAFRPVSETWPVFGISVDLGAISPGNQPDPVVWALGLVREPLVTYTTDSSQQSRSAYYWSAYPTVEKMISAFLTDFSEARDRNLAFDNTILSAASAVSPEYAALLSLVTRQIFASMDITIPSAQPGQAKNTDVKIFMKDIGTSRRTNPVEVIYGAFPALLYFNTSLAGYLLQPLLEFQSSPRYKNAFASPDLGRTYPVIPGNTSDTSSLGVEHCGNMLIMAYAHAVKSGDGSLLSRYYPLLKRWADFLVDDSLRPINSITADGLSDSNMSNLVIKSVLGVYSMAKINEAVGMSQNTSYMDHANQMMKDWRDFAVKNDHIQSVYGQEGSWGLIYNLFPAIWLNTSLVDDNLLGLQAQFYAQQSSPDFGFGLDSSMADVAYPHWILLTAATIPSSLASVRNRLINMVHRRAYLLSSQQPMPSRYQTSDGASITGNGSPIHGAAFGILALGLQNRQINAGPVQQGSTTPSRKLNVGAMVGGIISGLAVLIFLAAILLFWRRRKQRDIEDANNGFSKPRPFMASALPIFLNTSKTGLNQSAQPDQGGTGSHWTSPTQTEPSSQWRSDWEGPLSQPRQTMDTTDTMVPPAGAAPSKHQEALTLTLHNPNQSISAMTVLSNPYSTSTETEDLRHEVEQLRREMNSIRAMAEPPPLYT